MIKIGIDPSINSTGICVNLGDGNCKYYIITNNITKKERKTNDESGSLITYMEYNKESVDGEYPEKERIKTKNLNEIVDKLSIILRMYDIKEAYMEGISYGSGGTVSLIELSGLNYLIRSLLSRLGIKYTIVSPTQNKKEAVGNGGATKDVMTYNFTMLFPEWRPYVDTKIKIDDLADAYFLSVYKK